MTFEIISTGSKGNAVVLNGTILIDCGVSFRKLEKVKQDLKLVLLTHIHSDHFKPSTVRRLHEERPTLRFACAPWMVEPLVKAGVASRAIDVIQLNLTYSYGGLVDIQAVPLVHDVPNCGWHLHFRYDTPHESAFYATDTGSLAGVQAPGYDLYLVEANHVAAELEARLEAEGVYAYERRAAVTHLSREQAMDWLAENMGPKSRYVFLHQHEEAAV